jgi:hypothetical protein
VRLPLSAISLGILPVQEAVVTTTASAVVYDVRTAFIHGLAEATARKSQMTNLGATAGTQLTPPACGSRRKRSRN